MEMIENVFTMVILALAVPLGFWIAWLARDELRVGRRWFAIAVAAGIVLALAAGVEWQAAGAYTGIFIAVLAGVAYRKSFDRKWTRAARA